MKYRIILIGVLCSLPGCQRPQGQEKIAASAASSAAGPSLDLAPAVNRLTPEQISRQIKQSLAIDMGWTDDDGRFHDSLVEGYGVPLGGIDFVSAHKRDPTPKVQTLLLVHRIAYDVADAVVWRESRPDNEGTVVFQHCHLNKDFPGSNASMDARWMAQLEDFYWRLLARPPTAAEKALVRATAIDIMQREKSPPTVWRLVLYALLSSQEFWTI